jgi:hypothetical protein
MTLNPRTRRAPAWPGKPRATTSGSVCRCRAHRGGMYGEGKCGLALMAQGFANFVGIVGRACVGCCFCARGGSGASCVASREDRDAGCDGLRRRPGLKATGRRFWGICRLDVGRQERPLRRDASATACGSKEAAAPHALPEAGSLRSLRLWLRLDRPDGRKAKAHRPRSSVRWHENRERSASGRRLRYGLPPTAARERLRRELIPPLKRWPPSEQGR